MSNAHLNGERPIFPSSSSLQKRVHAIRQYRQMERLRNIIFGGYRANVMPNPVKIPNTVIRLYQTTYSTVIRALILSEFLLIPIILEGCPLSDNTFRPHVGMN